MHLTSCKHRIVHTDDGTFSNDLILFNVLVNVTAFTGSSCISAFCEVAGGLFTTVYVSEAEIRNPRNSHLTIYEEK